MQLDLFPDAPADHRTRARDGATWWVDNYECRNWRGWFQSREGGRGEWEFYIPGFRSDTQASVCALDENGNLCERLVPINAASQITVEGRRWGRRHWNH